MSAFPRVNSNDNIGDMELNKIFLNSIPNLWGKQAYVHGFGCKILILKSINIFECMEIDETIY